MKREIRQLRKVVFVLSPVSVDIRFDMLSAWLSGSCRLHKSFAALFHWRFTRLLAKNRQKQELQQDKGGRNLLHLPYSAFAIVAAQTQK